MRSDVINVEVVFDLDVSDFRFILYLVELFGLLLSCGGLGLLSLLNHLLLLVELGFLHGLNHLALILLLSLLRGSWLSLGFLLSVGALFSVVYSNK